MIRRPASKRLLTVPYILQPKTQTDDGQGGRTNAFNAADEVTLMGTERYIDTEEFVDVLGPEVADRGVYITWVDPTNRTPVFEDRIKDPNDNTVFEIKRVTGQLGLKRIFMVEVV